uniref:Farnesyl pyrophosphate synthase n=1 Tax=Corethrella appendiculata TaxID=1370023 RepID=U5ETY6_9DIPT
MFSSIIKNSSLQNLTRQLLVRAGENQNYVRCISKSSEVNNSDYITIKTAKPPKSCKDKQQIRLKKVSRTLSTLNYTLPVAAQTTVSKDECRDFMAVFPDIVRDLTDFSKKYDSKLASQWFARVLQYNVPNGKKNRGLATVLAYKMLAKPDELTEENVRLAHYLGWCVEMLQATFLIIDDIMDGSLTRRGQLCWYKQEDVKLIAINDAIMIENGVYHILKKHFSEKPYYLKLMEKFHEVFFITSLGQSLDVQTATLDVTKFTMDRYKRIVSNKTAYYTFYLPVALAMDMTGFKDPEVFRQTRTILLEIGQFFQAQDDFLDCFGDPEVTGKIGTDIQDGKCTWLSVVCMQRASEEQKDIMKKCYGSQNPDDVARIKKLYEELGLPTTYSIYEEESYNMIKTHIQQISRGLPHELFFKIMEKIYRRES